MVFGAGDGNIYPVQIVCEICTDFTYSNFRIFIIEGIITCLVAITAWFIILDFPDKAEKKGFLTSTEAAVIMQRIEDDRGDSVADPLTWAKFFWASQRPFSTSQFVRDDHSVRVRMARG